MIELTLTCSACPEQYDAMLNGQPVGYLRLRHGYFTVACPDVGNDVVYGSRTKGDGCFDKDERHAELNKAVLAIYKWLSEQEGEPIYRIIDDRVR